MRRTHDINRFYELLTQLRRRVGGHRYLKSCHGKMNWPRRGVYFFFEKGEQRADGVALRVVRVGTHALTSNSKSTLWQRLRQHRGTLRGSLPGGGNHRGSVFRLHLGKALLNSGTYESSICRSWGIGHTAKSRDMRAREHPLEKDVSAYIGRMPFLWVGVPDAPGPDSDREVIEANAVAMLSGSDGDPNDPPSGNWLGLRSAKKEIRESGLWNVRHVGCSYDPGFLVILKEYIRCM